MKILSIHIYLFFTFFSVKKVFLQNGACWNETSFSTSFSLESQPSITEKTGSYFMPDKSVGLVFKKRPSL